MFDVCEDLNIDKPNEVEVKLEVPLRKGEVDAF